MTSWARPGSHVDNFTTAAGTTVAVTLPGVQDGELVVVQMYWKSGWTVHQGAIAKL